MVIQLSSKANTVELNGVAATFTSVIVKSATTDASLLKLNGALKTNNEKLTLAIDKKLGSDKTDIIWELEGQRDDGLKSFFISVEGCTYRLNKSVRDAGNLLYEVIKRHGRSMYKLPYVQQTAKMDSLFKDLSQPAMVAALQTTLTTDAVEETKNANQDFLDAVNDRTNDSATKEEISLIAAARNPVKTGMEKIMNYLNSVIPDEDRPELEIIFASLTQVITDANSVIKARITRKEKEKEKTGTKQG